MKIKGRSPINLGVVNIDKGRTNKKPQRPRWLTPTSINTYLRCPRKFYYKYIRRLKSDPTIHLIKGIVVDRVLEQFYQLKLHWCAEIEFSAVRRTMLRLLGDEWKRHEEMVCILSLSESDLYYYHHETERAIIHFLDWFVRTKSYRKPEPLIQKILFSNTYRLRGRADMIEKSTPLIIIDWKTSKSPELTPEIKRQLVMYAFMYEEAFKIRPRVAAHFLCFQDGFREFKTSDRAIQEIKNLVIETHHKTQSIKIDDYPCTCGWCEKEFKTGDPKKK